MLTGIKKLMLILCAAGLTACGGDTGRTDGSGTESSAVVLRWGSDEAGGAPYEFRDPQDPSKLIGFEVEIADELAKRLGRKVEFVQSEWSTLISSLNRGDFDFAMAGLEITEDRKEVTAFSRPYYIYLQQLVVQAGNQDINSLEDCKGKRVGTLDNSAAERILKKDPEIQIVSFNDNVRPYDDLAIGRLDAVLLDLPIATYYAKPNEKLRFAGEPFGEGYYAIAVRKDDTALLESLNKALGEMLKDGTLQKILEKWELWNPTQTKLGELK